MIFTFSNSRALCQSAEENADQIVIGYEKVIEKTKDSEVRLVVETFYPETEEQLKSAERYIEKIATEALEANKDLNIEYVTARYEEHATLTVTPLNDAAKKAIHETKEKLFVSNHIYDTALTPKEVIDTYGFSTLVESPRFFATEISVPNFDFFPTGEVDNSAAEELKAKKINRILTVVRAIGSLGINTFMVYNAIGSDMFSPLVLPAILFYPAAETLLQTFAGRYEGLLRKFNTMPGRLAMQTAVSFAAISIHIALMSHIGVTEFAWLGIAATAFKDAISTQAWWEMVIAGRPKFMKGQYVSFGLGVLGMTGLLFDSTGYNFGTYILYTLGGTGAIVWLGSGGIMTLQKDALIAAKFFKEKFQAVVKGYQKSCAALRVGSFGSQLLP